MKRLLVFLLVLNGPIQAGLSQASLAPSVLRQQLESNDVSVRIRAFAALEAMPDAIQVAVQAGAIPALLARETNFIETTLRSSGGRVGTSEKYGEGYSEYYSRVLDAVNQYGNKEDPNILRVLGDAVYNGDSEFAIQLEKTYGEQLLPSILGMEKSDLSGRRMQALDMLTSVARNDKELSKAGAASIHQVLMRDLSDKSMAIRMLAVRGIASVGTMADLAVLRKLAESDRGFEELPDSKVKRYFVREESQKAIAQIQRRSATR